MSAVFFGKVAVSVRVGCLCRRSRLVTRTRAGRGWIAGVGLDLVMRRHVRAGFVAVTFHDGRRSTLKKTSALGTSSRGNAKRARNFSRLPPPPFTTGTLPFRETIEFFRRNRIDEIGKYRVNGCTLFLNKKNQRVSLCSRNRFEKKRLYGRQERKSILRRFHRRFDLNRA